MRQTTTKNICHTNEMSHLPLPASPESTPLSEKDLNENKREDTTTDFATIIVKHLPSELSDAEARELFEHYGALDMRRFHAGKMQNSAFVDFSDYTKAAGAIHALNYLHLCGKILSVEFAKGKGSRGKGEEPQPPPHLEYSYPPPNPTILGNIVNSLLSIPKFYTQVLHLMNKMNLPPPFGPLVPPAVADENFFVNQQPPSSATKKTVQGDTSKRKRDELLSSSESELDSEEEEAKRKRTKRPTQAAITTSSTITHPPTTTGSGISIVISAAPGLTVMPQIDPSLLRNCVSLEALMSSRATQEELSEKFPNYQKGTPTSKLYLKNIAKTVETSDLEFIFGRYFSTEEEAKSLSINLMKTGKMKGQAFVKFPTKEQAVKALEEVHGYKLHGQPLVIQFGKEK